VGFIMQSIATKPCGEDDDEEKEEKSVFFTVQPVHFVSALVG
jgi:hypothetical protein